MQDLTKINKPFEELDKATKDALKAAYNGKRDKASSNIQMLNFQNHWVGTGNPDWAPRIHYRLNPVYQSSLETQLQNNTTPFGLLSEELQKAFKEAWNGKHGTGSNIFLYEEGYWAKLEPLWNLESTYRLSAPEPKWGKTELTRAEAFETLKQLTAADVGYISNNLCATLGTALLLLRDDGTYTLETKWKMFK